MKKLLSIVLSVALLLSMFTAIPVVAVEGEEVAPSTALGDYYKFTFGEDGDRYEYTVAGNKTDDTTGQATYKGNNFYPFWLNRTANSSLATYEYKNVDIGDANYDVLEIKNFENLVFVPMTKDGTPFEMIPGVKYSVNVKLFNPACNTWGQYTVAAGSTNVKSTAKVNGVRYNTNKETGEVTATPNTDSAFSPYCSIGGGIVSGQAWAANLKEGSYDTNSVTLNCICSEYSTEEKPIVCTHAAKSFNAYRDITNVVSIPEEVATYDEETNSYSVNPAFVDETPDDTSDDTYDDANNYLSFVFGGGNVATYKSYPIYSNATAEETAAASSVWQIISIEVISENFKSILSYSVNGEIIKTVEDEAGIELETVIPTAPEGKYFVGWYNDEEYTELFTSTTLEFGVKTVYARFADYGTDLRMDFDTAYPATAVQVTPAGNFWPLYGYSIKTSYSTYADASKVPAWTNDDLKNDLIRNGLSTEYPAGVVSFYSDRTWAMPGGVYFYNADGTLFVPKAGDTYKITYKYRAPVNNGKKMSINVVYGITNAHANKTTTGDKAFAKATLKWNEIKEPVSEWTTVTEIITIPEAADDHVPTVGLDIGGVTKVAIDTDADEVNDAYAFSMVQLDYMAIERVPVGKVTFMNADGSENSVVPVAVGEEIPYPVLKASLSTDNVWSASATEYVAPPKTLDEEKDITIYAYESPVISYENSPYFVGNGVELYPGAINYDNEMNAVVSDKEAYSGKKSMRLRNYGFQWVVTEANYNTALEKGAYKYDAETDSFVKLDEVPEFVPATAETIADGTAIALKRVSSETGMNVIRKYAAAESYTFNYKITFKYKATENNTTESTLSARLFPEGNIWWGSPAKLTGSFTFPAGATDGWVDGEIYISAENAYGGNVANCDQVLDLKFDGNTELFTNEIYLDDIVIEEVETATFNVLVENAIVEGKGNYAEGVFTSFALAAPVVKAESGATIKKWYTDEACTIEATEFVAGGVYYGTIGYVEFVDGETVTKVYYNEGDAIEYPAIAGVKGYDCYWSLNADSYVAVPTTFEENVTVYSVKDTVIGFNNYVGHNYSSSTNLTVTDELEAGNKVIKAQDNDYTPVTAAQALKEVITGEGEEAVTTIAWLTPGNGNYWSGKYMRDENGEWVKLSDVFEEAPEFEEGKYYSNRNNSMDHAISLWQLEVGKTYKVSFKYYLPETLTKEYIVLPITSYYTNIWYAGQYKAYSDAAYKIGTDATVGEWVEAELYFTNLASKNDFAWLFMSLYQSDLEVGDVAYFDDFALTEVQYATFVLPEGAVHEQGGILKGDVITVYAEMDEEIIAPLVIDADGNPVEIWADENGNRVTEFVNGGTYTVAPAFIYGDCDDSGEIDTGDLAALKLFLAGLGEVGLGADCDASGEVDTGDLAALKLFLAGMGNLGPAV